MSLSYLLDEDISFTVAEGLRQRGVDAVSVQEIGRANKRISDEDQLSYAAAEGRVLVTYNRADFQALDGQWSAEGRAHAGILWSFEKTIPRSAVGSLVRALEAASTFYDDLQGLCLPLQQSYPAGEVGDDAKDTE